MRMFSTICALALAAALWNANAGNPFAHAQRAGSESPVAALAYLGFDSNHYPGDVALPVLKRTFSFAGYWLNPPPGTTSNTWTGMRAVLRESGFGFLVLFNGRTSRQLRRPADAAALGASDARIAADRAKQEGFSIGTVIFLDQEEGGRLLPEQRDYLFSWIDGVIAAGLGPGVYCSGIPAKEGKREFIITANDIHDHAGARNIAFFVLQ